MNDHYMFNYVYFKLHADHVVECDGILNAMEWYVRKQVYSYIGHLYCLP